MEEPLLSTLTEEVTEVEPAEGGMPLNNLNRSVTNPNERLRRFLNTIGLNLEDLSAFVSQQGEDSETFIQHLQQLFDHEKSCSSGFKWAALDHLVEKYLQWPFLSKSDLSGDSKCCTARVRPAQRSVLLKSLGGLIKAYGARGFVKGVEFTLSRTVRYFIYSMVTYRMLTWYQTGRLEFQEFRQIFDKNTEKGIDTLVRELAKVPPLYLNLILSSPLIIGGLYALNGMRGAKAVRPEAIEKATSDLIAQLEPIPVEEKRDFVLIPEPHTGLIERFRFKRITERRDYPAAPSVTQSKSSRSFFKNTFQEFFPPFSWFSTTPKLQKSEKLIRWDGRISPEERLQLFNVLRQTAQKSHQLTQIYAMECLAKIAHGVGLKDLHKLKDAGCSPEAITAVVYTKTLALQTLSELTNSNPDHPILALPRRVYATYLLWWLGLSTSYLKQKIPFSAFKAAKTALEISFLYEITKSIMTAINCPDKPGYKFAEGFADWASEYSLECFATALKFFRSIDPKESVEEFAKGIDQYHLSDLKSLDLNDKNLNATELYTLLQAIVKRAPQLKELKINRFNSFGTLIPGTFQGLSQLQRLDLNGTRLTVLLAGVFQGLSQLQSLDLSRNDQLTTLMSGVFQGLSQLQSLELNGTALTTLPAGVFQGLSQLKSLSFGFYRTPYGTQCERSINNLSIEVFQGLGQLKNLDLRCTFLKTLPIGVFQALGQLQSLDLSWNDQLTTLMPGVFQGLSQLQSLDLRSNYKLTMLLPDVFQGLSQLQSLDLSDNWALITLPAGVFQGLSQLQSLDLAHSGLTTLPIGVFQGLSQLQKLSLRDNVLTTLPTGVFQDLIQLQILNLYRNILTNLSVGVFQNLSQLQELSLADNKLTNLPAGVFDGLRQLQTLDLSCEFRGCGLKMPVGIFRDLNQLKILDLEDSGVTLFAGIFQGLSQLQFLNLPRSLTTLSAGVFQGLSQLQSLDLTGNERLTTLKVGVFQGLSQLKELTLLNNPRLTTLPVGVFQDLNQLQNLNLIYNGLTTLPIEVARNLSQLQSLRLSGPVITLPAGVFQSWGQLQNLTLEGLTTLSDEVFQGLNQLKNLDLRGSFTTLPDRVFLGLSQLKNLRLMGSFTTLPDRVFLGLSQLKNLDLSFNDQLTTLMSGVFQGLSQLQSLDLNWNDQLTTLMPGVFQGLSQLQSLDLSRNDQLTTLTSGVFQGLSQLQSLELNGTALTTLPAGVFQGLSQLKSLSLGPYDNGRGDNVCVPISNLSIGAFQGLSQLKSLDLRCTSLRTLPVGVFQGLQLQSLELNGIALTTLPAGVFQGLSQLKSLSLGPYYKGRGDNICVPISNLSIGAFQGLSQLKSLDLRCTPLRTLPVGVFQGLGQLQRLDLNQNPQLITLPAGVFQGLSQLQRLDLSQNKQLTTLPAELFQGLSQLKSIDLSQNKQLTILQAGAFQDLNQLQTLSLPYNQLNDTAIFNLTQGLPYSLQTLDVSRNNISNTGVAALVQLLPCSNISTFRFIPSNLPLNDTALLLQQQRKTLERVCADRSCHANLPSKSCPPDSFYGRMHPKEISIQPSALYALPTSLTWVGAASSSLPTLSSCSEASNPVVITAGGSALVVGSVGLGVLFYKNCTVLQSFVTTTQNFVIRYSYGKAQKPSADSIETHASSTPAVALRTFPQKSSICNFFSFFKPAKNPPPNLDAKVDSQQSMQL